MDIKALRIKDRNIISMFLSGLLYVFLGLAFLFKKDLLVFAIRGLINLTLLVFILLALAQLLGISLKKEKGFKSMSSFLAFLSNIAMVYLLYFKPKLLVAIFPLIFGLYVIVSGLVRALIYIQYRKNQVEKRLFVGLGALLFLIIGLVIIKNPLESIIPLSKLIGLFFLLYGLTYLIDGFIEGLAIESKNSLKRRIRINLPVFMVALIPHRIMKKINKALEVDGVDVEDLTDSKADEAYDLEVLIHVTGKGVGIFGHVDICFEGRVLTYGTYDEATYKLGGLISDGVLMEIPSKEDYIAFSQAYAGKTIFGFGLVLDDRQKERVRQRIEEIYQDLYLWKPLSQIDEEEGKGHQARKDYASIVYDNLRAIFYKFHAGPFKTYFGLNTNCVLLADSIVGQAGIDIIKIQGLITPGAYFEYFNREFTRRNSFVVSRNIYHKGRDDLPPI